MERNHRIERHRALVERIARQMLLRLPPSVTWEELVSAGYIGLIEAVDRFDPERNTDFSAFARTRIRGAMLDALRELDLLPRSIRERINAVQRTLHTLQGRLGRTPDEQEIADELRIPLDRVREVLRFQLQTHFVSFDESPNNDTGDKSSFLDRLADEDDISGQTLVELREAQEELKGAFATLPERLRLLLVLYYVEELTMQEIATTMSLTVGRISQLHSAAIETLRKELGDSLAVDRRRLALLFRTSLNADS